MNPICTSCGFDKSVKNGVSRHGHQRYRCKQCGATFGELDRRRVDDALKLPIDTSAAITSEGILGGSYISLVPGGEPDMLRPGDEITDTQGATDLMGLIGSVINKTGSSDPAPAAAPQP